MADSVLIRPDFYVYGSAVAGGVPERAGDFLADLKPVKGADAGDRVPIGVTSVEGVAAAQARV
ncbi:hypothetical protein NFJ07_00315 [Arthrobacter sp. B2a2-09]|nr:hypothetical protein [Arthrobacter sp. B2a2-09]